MRLPHLQPFAKDPLYFFTAGTEKRRPVLANAAAVESLRAVWRRSAEIDGWFVGRFVIMPDHVHLFARPSRESKSRGEWVKVWKAVSSRQIARTHDIEPPIWQRDYFDHILRSARSYSEKWDYVWNNPVRHGLATKPDDWPWQGVIHELEF